MAHATDLQKPVGYGWRSSRLFIVVVVSIAMCTDTFLFSFIVPILPAPLRYRLRVAPSHIQFTTSIVLSMNALVSIAIAPFTGYLADRISKKNSIMLCSYLVNMIGTVLTACSTTLGLLLVGRLIQTIAGSLIWIAGMAILGGTVGPDHLQSNGLLSLSAALFEFVPYMLTWLSALLVLLVGTVLQFLIIEPYNVRPEWKQEIPRYNITAEVEDGRILLEDDGRDPLLSPSLQVPHTHSYHTISTPDNQRPPASSSHVYWKMLCKRRVLVALIADTFMAVLSSSFEATIPIHIRDVFHWESLQAGLLFLLLQVPTLTLVFPVGWLKDRIVLRLPVTIGFVLMAPSLWLLGVPGNKHFGWANNRHTGEIIYIVTLVAIGICRTLMLGFGGVEVLRGANELATESPGIFGSGTGYSRAFALSNVTWKFGMFVGPLASAALTEVIALARGTGDLGRYLHEELVKGSRYAVALLTRKVYPSRRTPLPPPQHHHPPNRLHRGLDPDHPKRHQSQSPNLDHPRDNNLYQPLHTSLLNACIKSTTCKRFIPSEWAGNIEDYPDIPSSYGKTRAPFRKILQTAAATTSPKLKWTLFNLGWFMDYFVSEEKSYMKYLEGEFPIDLPSWTYCVRGTGEEPQSWTCGRDVAKAVAELLASRPFKRTYHSVDEIEAAVHEYEKKPDNQEVGVVKVEQWTVTGATACPREKTLRQREEYFSAVHFMSLEEMLEKAEREGHI
ncbi:major facilitator superfamily domain-containing protein [Aspergillus egyptiacus]|nr:major facilitator superfamily domain-containing protein [Aspergillus egyptiacus]